MRIAEAKKILSGKLELGNAEQIRALKVLEQAAELNGEYIVCTECRDGQVNCPICNGDPDDEFCSICDDEGMVDCPDCKGRGRISIQEYQF